MALRDISLKDFFLVPNLLSLSRVVFVVIYFYLLSVDDITYFILALIILFLGIISDMLDGMLARKLNIVTEIGKILDPICDKIALGFGSLAMVLYIGLPWWLLVLIVGRDICIVIGGIFLARKKREVHMANFWGKMNTVALAFMAFLFILNRLFLFEEMNISPSVISYMGIALNIMIGVVVVVHVISFISYLTMFLKEYKQN